MSLRSQFLSAVVPLTKLMGRIHAPFSHKEVTGYHVYSIVPHLKAGAGFVTYTNGEFSNLFIPGRFSHYAMYYQEEHVSFDGKPYKVPYVIEAIGKGVCKTDLITFLTRKDRVVLIYPTFCDEKVMTRASEVAARLIGQPYDYGFASGNNAWFCSEVGQHAYKTACKEANLSAPFTKRNTWGEDTVTPQDYINSTAEFSGTANPKWRVAWDSAKINIA